MKFWKKKRKMRIKVIKASYKELAFLKSRDRHLIH
jgi:hypothetical protein